MAFEYTLAKCRKTCNPGETCGQDGAIAAFFAEIDFTDGPPQLSDAQVERMGEFATSCLTLITKLEAAKVASEPRE